MLRFLSTVLAVFAGLVLFMVFIILVIAGMIGSASRAKPLPKSIVLELDARQPITDGQNVDTFLGSVRGGQSVVGIVEALEQARQDPAVKGLYIRANATLGLEPGQVEEIRDAVMDFKSAGKFVYGQVQDLSDPGLGGYFLLSAADQIWMQPSGVIYSQGVAASSVYFKGTLDKLDSSAEVLAYHEYKTAFNAFINAAPTDAEREEDMRQLQTVFDSFTGSIAKARAMTRDQFVALLGQGPFTAPEALKAHWIDKLGYSTDAEAAAKARAGDGADTVDVGDYVRLKGSPYKSGPVVAFIEAQGEIIDGLDQQSLFNDTDQFGSDSVTKAIIDATDDAAIKAIVFRINSPGGAAAAPDEVWNAIARARAKGKPVVVDMSGVAASAGYWIAADADQIVAEPSTITGSIGVIGTKFVLKGLLDKLGVSVAEMSVGGNESFMDSPLHPFTPEEWAALHKEFDFTYGIFIDRVAQGRKLPVATVQDLAKGRVWTGIDAKDRGLVDQLGGLKVAIAAAKKLAHIAPSSSIELRSFPGQKGFFEQIFSAFGASSEVAHSLGAIAQVLQLGPTAELLKALRAEDAAERAPLRAEVQPVKLH